MAFVLGGRVRVVGGVASLLFGCGVRVVGGVVRERLTCEE